MKLVIQSMEQEHLREVERIESLCFPVRWPENSFQKEIQDNRRIALYLVALLNGRVIGYAGAWSVLDEAHITTVAVDPDFQNRSVATALVLDLLGRVVEAGVRWATLEVREGNEAAFRLYQRFGFTKVGVRKGYYDDGSDALVMWAGNLQGLAFRTRLEELKKNLETVWELDTKRRREENQDREAI